MLRSAGRALVAAALRTPLSQTCASSTLRVISLLTPQASTPVSNNQRHFVSETHKSASHAVQHTPTLSTSPSTDHHNSQDPFYQDIPVASVPSFLKDGVTGPEMYYLFMTVLAFVAGVYTWRINANTDPQLWAREELLFRRGWQPPELNPDPVD